MKKTITFLIIAAFAQLVSAQDITVNLANGQGSTISQTINPQTLTSITLLNRILPENTKYSVTVEKMEMPMPPLPDQGLYGTDADAECDDLKEARNALNAENDEAKIASKIKALQAEIDKADKTTCKNTIAESQLAIASTRQTIVLAVPITIDKGEMVKITIKRDDKTWSYEFRTEQVNPWKVYFGFTYVPDVLSKFNNYYAKQDTGSTYLINKINGDNKNTLRNISPTVMFTYRFYKKEDQPAKFGLTGGFMYNLETLGAMFGPSLVIGDNLSINTGLAFVQKDKLRGQYMEGQRLKETLDFNQLHEKVWTYDMFVSIAFNIPGLFKKLGEKEKPATAE
ncbi:MAG: hypothetical protein ACO1N7_03360 [Sphingobacteriaceae bacterium]